MARVAGLDIGSKTIKLAIFTRRGKQLHLAGFAVEEIPDITAAPTAEEGTGERAEDLVPQTIEDLLKRLVKEYDLEDIDTVGVVDAKDCVIREFVVPFTRDDQIRKTIQFEAEAHFAGLDLDEAVLEYHKIGEFESKSRLIAWALRNAVVERRLGLYKRAGVDPVALDLDAAALFNAFALTPTFDPERTTLLIDMGMTSTKIAVIDKGDLKKVRALRLEAAIRAPERMIPEPVAVGASQAEVGAEAPSDFGDLFSDWSIEARFQEIERALKRLDPENDENDGEASAGDEPIAILSDEDFERLTQEEAKDADASGAPSDRAEAQAAEGSSAGGDDRGEKPQGSGERKFPGAPGDDGVLDPKRYFERVAVEIQRTLATAELTSPVELICITGGMSAEPDACRYLREEFDIETIRLDFGDSFSSELDPERHEEVGRVGAVAVGLAAKLLDRDQLGLDFRKGPYRYEHRLERLKFPLLVTSALFFLLFLQATFWAFRDWQTEKLRLEGYREKTRAVYQAFFEKELPPDADPVAAARRRIRTWSAGGQGSQAYRYVDVVAALQNFAEVLKDTGLYFRIADMRFYFQARVTQASGRGRSRSGRDIKPPPDSRVTLVTEDPDAPFKLQEAFNRSPKSTFFTVRAQSPSSGKEGYRVELQLTVRPERLKELVQ